MQTFHRFFWTFNGALAVFFAFRSAFLLLFKQTEDTKLWLIILIFCLFYIGVSAYGYHMYIGIKLLTRHREKK